MHSQGLCEIIRLLTLQSIIPHFHTWNDFFIYATFVSCIIGKTLAFVFLLLKDQSGLE